MNNKKLIRQQFRNAVFKRDAYKCIFCDADNELNAHHITDRNEMPNGGYVLENGATLCPQHHMMAEKFHISGGKEWEPGFHPDDLYKEIGSSKEKAIEVSEKL